MYKTNFRIDHGIKEILKAHRGPFVGEGHKGIYEILTTSWRTLNLAFLGSLTIVVAHHMYSKPPYPYLANLGEWTFSNGERKQELIHVVDEDLK
jgi:photosystem I P700 chlorophyll a apoprotein A1